MKKFRIIKKFIENNIIYLCLALGLEMVFYGLLFISDRSLEMLALKNLMVINLLVLSPLAVIIATSVLAVKKGLIWWWPAVVVLLFMPAFLTYYDETATIYAVIYAVLALITNLIANYFKSRKKIAKKDKKRK